MKSILSLLKNAYGLEARSLEAVAGGCDPHADSFKVTVDDGRRFFLKVRPTAGAGFELSAILAESGVPEVVAPIRAQNGAVATTFEDRMIVVLPFIEGSNALEKTLLPVQWTQVGSALRRVHDASLPHHLCGMLDQEPFEVEGLDEFAIMLAGLDHDARQDPMAMLLSSKSMEIEFAIDTTRKLGDLCKRGNHRFVPCHADLHEANLLVDEGGMVRFVDWDLPRMSPRECDVMFFVEQGIFGEISPDCEKAFFEGYGKVDLDPVLLAYFRFARVAEDLVSYYQEALGSGDWESDTAANCVRGIEGNFKPGSTYESGVRMASPLGADYLT